jgi:hypothetical protein
VESATGRGATFSFVLPLNRGDLDNRQIKSEEKWARES